MTDNSSYQQVAKKENNNFLVGIAVVILIELYATNPTKKEFNEFISKQVQKKMVEKSGEQNFITNLVAGVAGSMVNEVSERKDYVFFSTYKVDLSVIRMFGGDTKDMTFVGIGGQFIPLSGVGSDAPSGSSSPTVAPAPAPSPDPVPAPSAASGVYNSIYYAASNVREFGWANGYATQENADTAAYNSCLKQNQGECKKLLGGQYHCLAIYQNSINLYAALDDDLETAKQRAYTNCSKASGSSDTCTIPSYGTACSN